MTEEGKNIEMFKRYINSLEQKLEEYYRIDEEFYKDNIEDLELNIKLARYVLNLIEKKDKVIDLAIKNLNHLGGMYHLKAKDNTYSSRNVETVKMTAEEIKEYFYKQVEVEDEVQNT